MGGVARVNLGTAGARPVSRSTLVKVGLLLWQAAAWIMMIAGLWLLVTA